MRYVVVSASSRNAIVPFSGPAVPRSWREEGVGSCGVRATDGPPTASLRVGGHAWDTAEHPVLQRPPGKLARLPVQLWAGQSMVVVDRDRHGEAPGVTGRQAWRTPCHAVPQRDGRSCLAGVGFLGGADHGQTPQDSDLPPSLWNRGHCSTQV